MCIIIGITILPLEFKKASPKVAPRMLSTIEPGPKLATCAKPKGTLEANKAGEEPKYEERFDRTMPLKSNSSLIPAAMEISNAAANAVSLGVERPNSVKVYTFVSLRSFCAVFQGIRSNMEPVAAKQYIVVDKTALWA